MRHDGKDIHILLIRKRTFMRIIDLSHVMDENMPVYPGTEPPEFFSGCSIEKDGFIETKITLYSHTGTHVDAPAHLLEDGATLDRLPMDHFYGKATVVNLREFPSAIIDLDRICREEDRLRGCEFLLLNTGWDRHWGQAAYFRDFPVLSDEAAFWIAAKGIKGVGVDTISVDKVDSTDLANHKHFLQRNMIIIENLTNLECIDQPCVDFSCFPLAFRHADGSPVRAVAYLLSKRPTRLFTLT